MAWNEYIIKRRERSLRKRDLSSGLFEITSVYPGSPACEAGIRVGMLYVPEKKYNFEEQYLRERFRHQKQKLKFIDVENETFIEIYALGFLYGLKMRRSLDALCRDLAYLDFCIDDIFEHVHDGNLESLKKINQALEKPGFSNIISGILRKFWFVNGVPDKKDDYFVSVFASLFTGAKYLVQKARLLLDKAIYIRPKLLCVIPALYYALQKDTEKAVEFLEIFESEEKTYGGMENAIYYYTKSLIAELENKDENEINSWLMQARESAPDSVLVRNRLKTLGFQAEDTEVPVSGSELVMPLGYVLLLWDPVTPRPERARLVSMNAALSKLKDDQFLIMISLASCRWNEYYSKAMYCIGMMHPFLSYHFPRVHIVTAHEPDNVHYATWWSAGEEYAFRQGVKMQLLYDPEYLVPDLLESDESPVGIVINKQGEIVYKGAFQDEECFWNAIASLSKQNQNIDAIEIKNAESMIA
ncbi:MAG: hypothetical protein ACRBBN_01155 [Methyloligellaceae bacterium]